MNRLVFPAVAGCALLLALVPSALQAGVIRLQAEDFHAGGQGIGWNNTTTGDPQVYRTAGPGQEVCLDDGGGYNITTTAAGEWIRLATDPGNWLTDPILPVNNYYLVTARVASAAAGAQAIRLELGPSPGVNLTGSMSFANTGGGQNWASVTAITRQKITSGTQQILAVWETANVNLNWIELATGSEWKLASGTSNWHVAANWTEGIPNTADAFAILGSTYGTGTRTVTVNAPTTVGHIIFDSTGKYTLSGSSTLTFQVSPGVDTARILLLRGNHDINAPVVLGSTLTVDVDDPIRTVAFGGNISGSGGLVKLGTGTVSLKGAANTYTGGTTVIAGKLTVTSGGSLGPGLLTVASAGKVNLQVPTITVSGLSGSGEINLGSASPLVNATLRLSGTGNSQFDGSIRDVAGTAGRLEVVGGANLRLTAQNTYSGGTLVDAGSKLEVVGSGALGTGEVRLNGGTLSLLPLVQGLRGRYYDNGTTNPDTAWFATLAALNAQFDPRVPTVTALTTTGGRTTLNFGTTLPLFADQGFTKSTQFAARWDGYINVPADGTYTFWTSSDDGSMIWIDGVNVVNNNYYQGNTERSGTATLRAGLREIVICYYQGTGGGALNVSSNLLGSKASIPNSLLYFPGGTLALPNNITLTANSAVDVPLGSTSLQGAITGAFGLTKTGSGTLVLANTGNTYSGTTIVAGGTLALGGSLPNSAVVVQDGSGIALGTASTFVQATLPSLTINQTTSVTSATFKLGLPTSSDKLTVGTLGVTGQATIRLIDAGVFEARTFPLIQYTNFAGTLANFTLGTPDIGDYTATLALNTGTKTLEAVLNYVPNQWRLSGSGTWGTAANWTKAGGPGIIPDGKGTANFLGNLTASGTIDIAGTNRTVRLVKFDNTAASYTIAASGMGRLIFDNDYGNARIWAASGSHTISAPVQLNVNTDVTAAAGATVTISGPVTGTNRTLRLDGPGNVNMVLAAAGNNSVNHVAAGSGAKTMGAVGSGTSGYSGSLEVQSAAVLHAGAADSTVIFGGPIFGSGSGGISKTGTGTVVLANTNSYAGPTQVLAGTLKLAVPPANAAVWLDASDLTTITKDANNKVRVWADKSGNNRNATQNTVANQPTLATNALVGNQTVMRFSRGSSTFMNIDFSWLVNTNYTIAAIEGRTTADTANYFLGTSSSTTNQGLHFGYRDNTTFTLAQYGNDLNGTVPGFTTQSFDMTIGMFNSAAGHYLYRNGTLLSSNTNLQGFTAAPGGLVGRGYASGHFYTGDLAEILMYSRALTTAERQMLEAYLTAKWRGGGSGVDFIPDGFDLSNLAETVAALRNGPGGGGLAKIGTGTLTLAGPLSSAFSGRVENQAPGTLRIAAGNHTLGRIEGTGNTLVEPGATLTATWISQNTLTVGGTDGNPGKVVLRSSAGAGEWLAAAGPDQLGAAAVPEPASLILLVTGALSAAGLLRLRRRN
jgi:autotransporter-associated beta strand protein